MFPRLVFRSPGPHQCQGGTYAYAPVSDQKEADERLADGWFATLPEAIEGKAAVPEQDDNAPPTRDELERKATELDIKFDGRTSDRKLGELIEVALKD